MNHPEINPCLKSELKYLGNCKHNYKSNIDCKNGRVAFKTTKTAII